MINPKTWTISDKYYFIVKDFTIISKNRAKLMIKSKLFIKLSSENSASANIKILIQTNASNKTATIGFVIKWYNENYRYVK